LKHSDSIKAILFATINELTSNLHQYVVTPGKDFTRNRKIGFKNTIALLLTLEGDCIKEEIYRFFGRKKDAPSKAAFYKQRRKLNDQALAALLYMFNSKLKKKLYNGKYQITNHHFKWWSDKPYKGDCVAALKGRSRKPDTWLPLERVNRSLS
jgi:hypothetical protein